MPSFITVKKFCVDKGYTRHSCYAHISRGHWPEGVIWRKAPNGRIFIDPEAHDRVWVAQQSPTSPQRVSQ